MKKSALLISTIFLLISTVLEAQTNKGNLLLGVSSTLTALGRGSELMSFSHSSTKTKGGTNNSGGPQKQTGFGLSPKAGYFIFDNMALGLDMSLVTTKDQYTSPNFSSTDRSTILALGPFARYYIPAGKVYPFLEAAFLFGSYNEKYSSSYGSSDPYENSLTAFGGGAGLATPLGNKVTFDAMLVYYSYSMKEKQDNPDNIRIVTGLFGVKLGFIVFLF